MTDIIESARRAIARHDAEAPCGVRYLSSALECVGLLRFIVESASAAPPAAVPVEASEDEVSALTQRLKAAARKDLGPFASFADAESHAREALRWRDETRTQQPAAAVPEGYALVPVEPTQGMLDAAGMSIVPAGKEWLDQSNRETWAAMLAAIDAAREAKP